MTWKQVWVKRSTCSVTAATTRGADGPDRGHGDAGGEVDEAVAVDVLDDPAGRADGEDRQRRADAGRQRCRAAGHQLLGAGPGTAVTIETGLRERVGHGSEHKPARRSGATIGT